MDDRIRLAEAMGWHSIEIRGGTPMGVAPRAACRREVPNPFADANADYAVLEWIRHLEAEDVASTGGPHPLWVAFYDHLQKALPSPVFYMVGDFARAARKAMEDGK